MTVIGLDTVAVSIPLADSEPPQLIRLSTGTLGVVGPYGRVEASLPVRRLGHNLRALRPDEAVQVIEELVEEALRYVEPADYDGVKTLRLSRVDIVRDFFGVEDIHGHLEALRRIAGPAQTCTVTYGHGRTETLEVGNARWKARLYDKHRETNGVAAPGHLRFEAELRKKRLSSKWARDQADVLTVADLDEDRLVSLALSTFDHVGFDHWVQSRASLASAIERIPNLSPTEATSLLGHVVALQEGTNLGLGAHARQKYNRLARSYKVLAMASGSPRRLDWESGRLVVEKDHARITRGETAC